MLLAAGQLVLFRTQIRMGRRKKERKNKNKKVQSRPADFTMADGETTFRQPSWPRLFKANLSGKSLGLFQLTTTKKKRIGPIRGSGSRPKGRPPTSVIGHVTQFDNSSLSPSLLKRIRGFRFRLEGLERLREVAARLASGLQPCHRGKW